MTPRSTELDALSRAVTSAGLVRLPLEHLWLLWIVAAPRLHGDPDQAAELSAALAVLKGRGVIELPTGAWDRSTNPALPRSVTVPAARSDPATRPWRTFPWCAQLGWASSLPKLPAARFDELVAINAWVARTGGLAPVVLMRYRSAELFGDEKRLETMARTNLFGGNRINLDMLACTRVPPPLAAAPVGDGPDVLVTENSDPYWAAVDILRATADHTIGLVVWGAGKSFPAQVPALAVDLAGHGPVSGIAWYWGDMDPAGLAIATEAARISKLSGGPPILPAQGLWEAMGDASVQRAGRVDWPSGKGGDEWLGSQLSLRLNNIRVARGRVAQEAVPPSVFHDWAITLGARKLS